MCGIVGCIDLEQDLSHQREQIAMMNGTQIHRGPDAEGIWISQHAALAHRRLIVIDPKGGAQPMVKLLSDRKMVITYNGELYNMKELRGELLSLGYRFSSYSDTELILTAYDAWGTDCPRHLNGIFAFAIWDEGKQELFIARDRMGVKPLFYAQVGSTLLLGSEIKSLLAHPRISSEVGEEGVSELLVMGPARTPGVGIFRQIQELRPGHGLRFSHQGLQIQPYWRLTSTEHTDDFLGTVQGVRDRFEEAVKRQLVSDMPIGAMLSGGLDSSAISAYAAQVFAEENRGQLITFSVDYVDNDKHFTQNEFQPNADAPWAQLMADHIRSDHHRVEIDNEELFATLMQAMRMRDFPGMADIDASLFLFCREIKKKLTVVLSGECADELFGGYPWFHRQEMLEARTFPWAMRAKEKIGFLSPDIQQKIQPIEYMEMRYQEALHEVPHHESDCTIDRKMREMFYLNLTRWMPTLLDRKDRMSMAAGLEVRVPFCDHHLLEYVWNIPWAMKNYQQREKGLLRYALRGLLPEKVIERKKSPFPKTHHPDYIRGMQRQMKQLLQDHSAPLFQLLDRNQVAQFVNQDLRSLHLPWFGQLMNVPALLAYWLQLNQWLQDYRVSIRL